MSLRFLPLLLFPALFQAAAPFNPPPAVIQSPRDDDALARLTVNSAGKTPIVKNLQAAWVKSLANRGTPTVYTRDNSKDFAYLGMPVGGIGAGELYLGGDGRLWEWDIFNTKVPSSSFPVENGSAYVHPHIARAANDSFQNVIDQGFVIRTRGGGHTDTRTLDKQGFTAIRFSGQYPVGSVDYSDPASPVRVHLDAFSPFIPGNVADSSYPATTLSYTVENTSQHELLCTLAGWLQNAAALATRNQARVILKDTASDSPGCKMLNLGFEQPAPSGAKAPQVFDDFSSGQYTHWKSEGTAFGTQPVRRGAIGHGSLVEGVQGDFYIDTYLHGNDGDTGTLTSDPFVISRAYITFLIGGGGSPKETFNLIVDGKAVRTATGNRDEILRAKDWDVKDLAGKTAQIKITDSDTGGWGHILVDDIAFADTPAPDATLGKQVDLGNMTLAVLGAGSEIAPQLTGTDSSSAALDAPAGTSASQAPAASDDTFVGAARRTISLAPGQKKTVSFVLAWYFPNPLPLGLVTPMGRQYGARFKSAGDVASHIAADFTRLTSATLAWRDAWYDSTLPYWFLDRTFLNLSTLATSTDYLLADGRFYGFEGRYSCPGTCTHVYGYQQAMGYVFPDLEKALREKAEFVPRVSFGPDGGVGMRAEHDHNPPVDGQSGIILRTYLAHRMSADNSFLTRVYPSVKKATDWLITKHDPDHSGILSGPQANTMDAAWWGKNTWMSLYYQAALRAAAEMADDSNDHDYATSLRAIAEKGRSYIEQNLFNGEYFYHALDPAHPDSPGTFAGCPLEQLMGQNWAYQVGLGDIIDHSKALTALDSIWKYDYTTDAGLYRKAFPTGRWYATAGESGLIMCTFPHGGEDTLNHGYRGFSAYDNECWPGSEYEITATMMWDGKTDKALAEIKSLQERFDGAKRNPWDECECGSHYSRSMASYGVFTAACGYEYDGPKGQIAFAPRVQPEDFKAAFTAAQGWGSYSQKYDGANLRASLALLYGQLKLNSVTLVLPPGSQAANATAEIGGQSLPVTAARDGSRVTLTFATPVSIAKGQSLKLAIRGA